MRTKQGKRCCRVSGCSRKDLYGGNGYCEKHHQQMYKHGRIFKRTMFDPNEIIDYGDYIGVCLYNRNNEKIAEALVDKCDEKLIRKYKWHLSVQKYVTTPKGVKMHKIIFPENKMTDHINRDRLDNRRCNLRKCDHFGNASNRNMLQSNSSGVTGVMFLTLRNKWKAQIGVDNKIKHLGYFTDFDEAVKVRKKAERKYFGEFAPN